MKVVDNIKCFTCLAVISLLLMAGGCPRPAQAAAELTAADASSPMQAVEVTDTLSPEYPMISATQDNSKESEEYLEYQDDIKNEEALTIADPLKPFNRVMYVFNDKLYFWMLKPVARGYKAVVPETARIGVKNFFSNLGAPKRFLSCLLAADFSGAVTELGRFTINTLWGIGGFLDPSAGKEMDLQKQDADLGQTLGVYGVGHGFYLVWPVFGPSSPRDTLELVGDHLLYPVSYLSPWYASTGITAYAIVNDTSLRIGDYESFKEAAIDPYVSMRDAYIQYRLKDVKKRRAKSMLFKDGDTGNPESDKLLPKK